ncbi:MAG: insulinase family protein [Bacteroidetes bacterium]|nr:insulinase family protein [Bacteroidota bacterium]
MKVKSLLLYLSVLLFITTPNIGQSIDQIDISYKKFILKNGLTLIVHEDHKAPIVAVNIWYHVGSKNEKPGKTGFAHLFEHLMFNGSENFDDDYFQALERVGATDLNGTTNNDRTNYFQNVPTSAFDVALWMESDRMGHLLGAITQEKLDEQRGVVQNEKRQGDNQPYSVAFDLITENSYPQGHPYSWRVIGSMEDLDAAALSDVHNWFKTYYGPNNAVLVIAGDVNPEDVYTRVQKYFGDIPPGPPIKKHETWIAKMSGTKRQIAQDRVPQSRIYMVWNIPESGNEELTYLDLASDILSAGKTSRLYKRLVYDDQIATDVNAYYSPGEIGSQFQIRATVKPGGDVAEVEKVIREELNNFLSKGPTDAELTRVKTNYFANFIRGIERIGGFGGKSDILAQSEVYGGSPDYYKKTLNWVDKSSKTDIKNASNKWLSDGVNVTEIHPYPNYLAEGEGVDRTQLPPTDTPPVAKFPKFEKTELSNGLKIVLAKRASIPVVDISLLVDAGYAADQFALAGTAQMTSNMLDEGTKSRNALQISEELSMLGAQLYTGSNLDESIVFLNSIKSNLAKSLEIFADIIQNPSFPEADFDRLKKQTLAGIQREKATPIQMALRVLPRYIYGPNHAYSNPYTGSGFESTVESMKRDDLIKFHQIWYKPNNATLIIVGDITMDEIKPMLEKVLASWKQGEVPQKNINDVKLPDKPVFYLVDKPQAPQSIIIAGHAVVPKSDKDNIVIEMMNKILGGSFTSRINMNLREDKHWSYGSRSLILDAKAQRPFLIYALVQSDKTKESVQEIYKEITQYISTKPATAEELEKIKLNETLSLPGIWETNGSVGGSLSEMVRFNYPEDYFDTYASKIQQLGLDEINKQSKRVLKPENIAWIIVGDKSIIGDGLKELGYEIKEVDTDGNEIK